MKKLVLAVMMAMVLAPICAFAWSDNFTPMSVEDMKKTYCMSAIQMDFLVVRSHDEWAGNLVNVVPARVETKPSTYTEAIVVVPGGPGSAFFEPGSTVIHHVANYTESRTETIVMESAAGIGTWGPSKLIRICPDNGGLLIQTR